MSSRVRPANWQISQMLGDEKRVDYKLEHLVLKFDFAQNLPVPRLNINKQFYCHLLWIYVFNVHVHNNSESSVYRFLETESRKSSNSVLSAQYETPCRFL